MKASVKLNLDTKDAAGQLKKLSALAVKSGKQVGKQVTSTFLGSSVGGFVGARLAQGRAAVAAPVSGGLTDVIGEVLGQYLQRGKDAVFGDLDETALSTRYAREQVIDAFAYQAGRQEAVSPQMRQYFEQIRSQRQIIEKGRELIQADPAFRIDVDKVVERFKTIIDEAISAGASWIISQINPLSGL